VGIFDFLKKRDSPIPRIRRTIQLFEEVSTVEIDPTILQNVERDKAGIVMLLYMFGALDILCQSQNIDTKRTLMLFQSLLQDELGNYSDEDAKTLIQAIAQASATPYGKEIMKEGAESIRLWINGLALPHHRLSETLREMAGRNS